MLTVICGEDSVSSRKHLTGLIEVVGKRGVTVERITPSQVDESLFDAAQALNLFASKKAFVVENLNKYITRKSELLATLEKIAESKDLELIDWEDRIAKRELKFAIGRVTEFKPKANVFRLLEHCYPSNLRIFVQELEELARPENEIFLFTMLSRHTRNLILCKFNAHSSTVAFWQKRKLELQAAFWSRGNLVAFYDKLLSIELALKSGKSVFGLKNSISLLACYYLKK